MMHVKVNGRIVGEGQPVFIIAEAGSNHNCDIKEAKRLIDAAVEIGADAVKFQSFNADAIAVPKVVQGDKEEVVPAYEVLKKYALPITWHRQLADYAKEKGIIFMSTPFDEEGVDLLKTIGVPAMKAASGDLTHLPLLHYMAKAGKPIFLATGMATLGEVEEAVRAIEQAGNHQIILMHCVTNYPTKFEDSNVRAMRTMAGAFHLPVGYSDHTPGMVVPLAAVALGACVIEKHFTFSRNAVGPDHPYAMEVEEFKEMVISIRQLEKALGTGYKKPVEGESRPLVNARRSIYAVKDLKKGQIITRKHIVVARPARGIAPKYIDDIVGRRAARDIKAFEPFNWGMILDE